MARQTSTRVLLITSSLCLYVCFALFIGDLTARLTVRTRTKTDAVKSLRDVLALDLDMIVRKGSAALERLSNAPEGTIEYEIYKKKIRYDAAMEFSRRNCLLILIDVY